MTTKTVLTNDTITIELDLTATKASQFQKAVEQGFNGSKTGFTDLLNGKIQATKGFVLKTIEAPKPKAVKEPKTKSNFDSVKALKALKIKQLEIKVPAVRQTYGSLKLKNGRLQITPIHNGDFGLLFYPSKGKDATSLLKGIDVEIVESPRYTSLKRVNEETLRQIIAVL